MEEKVWVTMCALILRNLFPHAVISAMTYGVIHALLQGLEEKLVTSTYGGRFNLNYLGLLYMLYKSRLSMLWDSVLSTLDRDVPMLLQWGLSEEHRFKHPWLVYSTVFAIDRLACTSMSDWLLALVSQIGILRSWPYHWLFPILAVRAVKYAEGGSFIIHDSLTSVIVWSTVAFILARILLLPRHVDESGTKALPSDVAVLLNTSVILLGGFLLVAVVACVYMIRTERFVRAKVGYFDTKRRHKIFGSTAARFRKKEPFMDRASRVNASWYHIYMPTISSDDATHIRLVRFISFDDEIRCEVKSFGPEQELPPYAALSYTCGDPDGSSAQDSSREELNCIQCNGQPFYTRPNLYHALIALQQTRCKSWLWIDTICINQGNSDDRLSQVASMGRIYHGAEEVLLWTGGLTPELEDMIAFCKGKFELFPGEGSAQQRPLDCSMWEKAWEAAKARPGDTARQLQASQGTWKLCTSIRAFWSRQWLRRAWILQEIALAKSIKVYCGNVIISWDCIEVSLEGLMQSLNALPTDFRRDMQRIRGHLPHYTDSVAEHLTYWRSVGGVDGVESTRASYLLYLIAATKRFECADPRDKIFCVMGMVNLDAPSSTDFTKLHFVYDTTVEDLYYWTAHYCIVACPSLTCLSLVGRRRQCEYNLPTWVPDFSASDQIKPLLFIRTLGLGMHGTLINTSKIQIDGPALHVYGKIIDTVIEVLDVPLGDLLTANLENLDSIFMFCNRTHPACLSDHSVAEALWRILACTPRSVVSDSAVKDEDFCEWLRSKLYAIVGSRYDKLRTRLGIQDPLQIPPQQSIQLYRDFVSDHPALRLASNACAEHMKLPKAEDLLEGDFQVFLLSMLFISHPMVQKVFPFQKVAADTCVERRLFRTKEGYIGMAVESIEPGDDIVALKASKVPFVLRGRQRYQNGSFKTVFPEASRWAEQDYDSMLSQGRFKAPTVGVFNVIGEAYLHGFMDGEKASEVACSDEDTICLL